MKTTYKLIFAFLFALSSISSFAACTAPSTSAGTPVFSCQSASSMAVTWAAAGTPYDCNGYVVIRRTTYAGTFSLTAGTALPVVGFTGTFGNIMNCYIEYVGSNLSITSDISAAVQYYYYIIPYNNAISGCSPAPVYRTTSIATATNLNPTVGLVSNFTNGTPTATTIPNISFSPPAGGADGYLVCTNPNGYHAYPDNGITYSIGQTFNHGSGVLWDQTVQYSGPNTSGITAATNLSPNTTYCINVYAWRNKYICNGGPVYVGTFAANTKDNVKTALSTGLAENAANSGSSVFLFPNPAKDMFTVYISTSLNGAGLQFTGSAIMDIYNTLGEKVLSGSFSRGEGNDPVIDISSLAKGIYFLRLQTDFPVVTKKFVKL